MVCSVDGAALNVDFFRMKLKCSHIIPIVSICMRTHMYMHVSAPVNDHAESGQGQTDLLNPNSSLLGYKEDKIIPYEVLNVYFTLI